jgi:hypothetical protein
VSTASDNMADWNTFVGGHKIIAKLLDINRFQFSAEVPMTIVWANDEVRLRVAQLVYDEVLEILRVAGLYRYDQVNVIAGEEEIQVSYSDDKYGFEISLRGERLTIVRQGSSFERFHKWYVEVAPHFGGLTEKVCAAIESSIRSVTSLERKMDVQDASYSFRFVLYDVVDVDRKLLNSEVVQGLLPQSPGPVGSLDSTSSVTESIARLDASFQKWQERDGRPWIEVYSVEAPSNRDWSSVWVTFAMVGRSFERPSDGVRVDFEAAAFIGDYVTPYVVFLRERGLLGFLAGVMRERDFSTTAGLLP